MTYEPPNKLMTPEDEKKIISWYKEGMSAGKILKKIGKFKTTKSIYDVLKKHDVMARDGYTCRDPNLDHFYFSKIDSADKAYLLGLIVSDGWVAAGSGWEISAKNYKAPQVGISLKEKDEYLVCWVKEQWKSQNMINSIQKEPSFFKGQEIKGGVQKRILVTSRRMYQDLHSLGVTTQKSKVSIMPLISQDFYSHFLRGLLDGDGTIGIYKYGGTKEILSFRFLGSLSLVAQISFFLHERLGLTYLTPSLKNNSQTLASIDYMIQEDTLKLVKFLYQDLENITFLKRKRAKIEDFQNHTNRQKTNI